MYYIHFTFYCHSERWVLHSTEQYAQGIISGAGLQKPSNAALTEIAEELFQEFQRTGFDVPIPFFKKAHRWFVCHFPAFANLDFNFTFST